jgi:signal transduction histidine kinase
MGPALKILILEDSISDTQFIKRLLKKEKNSCQFLLAMNKSDFVHALDEFLPDVILSDNSLPQFSSSEALKLARQRLPHVPFVLVTGTVSEEFAAQIIKSGADDYILKDRMARLPAAIEAALEQRRSYKEIIKSEEGLRQSEIRLNEAQAIAHISNWDIDLILNTHTWSDEMYRIYGINKGEIEPSVELFLSFIHPEDADLGKQALQRSFSSFNNASFHFRFIRKDGMIRNGYAEWRYEIDKAGRPLRLFGILQDTTEYKEIEENLKSLERKISEQKIQEQKKIARAIIKAQDRERNHIGKELHDNVNQLLAAAKIYLSVAAHEDKVALQSIKYPMELIESSIQEIRQLCQNLVAPLMNVNLEGYVNELLNILHQRTVTKTDFTYSIPENLLSDDLKLNIYRVLQEQITNILKYAEAENVAISIKEHEKSIHIMVADDGKGFDLEKKRTGIGISNMISRVQSFNGTIEIESSIDNGCRTQISIPY